MKSNNKILTVMGALLVVFAIGCAEEPDVETTTVAETEMTETTLEQEVPRLPDGSEPVQVVLSHMSIDMPSTLPEGTTLFTVNNEGDTEHSFEIEGPDMEKALDEPLQPGEVTTIEVDLFPGEYRVYCPVGDHAEQGMEMTLNVTPAEGTGAPTDTSGSEPPADDDAI